MTILKLIYCEKATKFCKIFTLLLSYVVPAKSKVKISQNFVAFSEYMNLTKILNVLCSKSIPNFCRHYAMSVFKRKNNVFGTLFFLYVKLSLFCTIVLKNSTTHLILVFYDHYLQNANVLCT